MVCGLYGWYENYERESGKDINIECETRYKWMMDLFLDITMDAIFFFFFFGYSGFDISVIGQIQNTTTTTYVI